MKSIVELKNEKVDQLESFLYKYFYRELKKFEYKDDEDINIIFDCPLSEKELYKLEDFLCDVLGCSYPLYTFDAYTLTVENDEEIGDLYIRIEEY